MNCVYHYHLIIPLKNGSSNHFHGSLTRSEPITDGDGYDQAIDYLCNHHRTKRANTIVASMSLLTPAHCQPHGQ